MPTLNWIGKEAVVGHHKEVPFKLLEKDENLSVGDSESGNLLIEGDNLEALKALLPHYKGKIKCIYIDPPYNTGNQNWIYNDNVSSPKMKEWLGSVVGKEDLNRHDKWLCMMYPRLVLLRELLSEEGLIFVSLDYNEIHHLRCIFNEIFGTENFLAELTWKGMHTVRNSAKGFNQNTEYILVFCKSINNLILTGKTDSYLRVPSDKSDRYPYDDNDGKGKYKLDPLHARNFYTPYKYTFENGVEWEAPKGRFPTYSPKTLKKLDLANEISFKGKEPKVKRYLNRVQEGVPPNTLLQSEIVGFNKDGTSELSKIFEGEKAFDQPKPTSLIKYLFKIQRAVDKGNTDYFYLDSFAGSGTTGHSVLQLNKEDGGNRKFILIEMEEKIAQEVTAKRLEKVIGGYEVKKNNGKTEKVEGLGGGFTFYKLGKTLFDANGKIRETVTFEELARHIFYLETKSPLTTKPTSPLIGKTEEVAVYLLYNGILKDKKPNNGNVLTTQVLADLPKFEGQKIVYGTSCRLSKQRLETHKIKFKQIPYDVGIS